MLAIDLMMEMARRAQPDRDFWHNERADRTKVKE